MMGVNGQSMVSEARTQPSGVTAYLVKMFACFATFGRDRDI